MYGGKILLLRQNWRLRTEVKTGNHQYLQTTLQKVWKQEPAAEICDNYGTLLCFLWVKEAHMGMTLLDKNQ